MAPRDLPRLSEACDSALAEAEKASVRVEAEGVEVKLQRLEQVVSAWDIAADMVDPVGWLTRQIRAGKVRARKIGRHWYMTDDDVRDALDVFASGAVEKPAPVADERPRGGLSAASMRRRIA